MARKQVRRKKLKYNCCIEMSEVGALSAMRRNLNIYAQSNHVILHHNLDLSNKPERLSLL